MIDPSAGTGIFAGSPPALDPCVGERRQPVAELATAERASRSPSELAPGDGRGDARRPKGASQITATAGADRHRSFDLLQTDLDDPERIAELVATSTTCGGSAAMHAISRPSVLSSRSRLAYGKMEMCSSFFRRPGRAAVGTESSYPPTTVG